MITWHWEDHPTGHPYEQNLYDFSEPTRSLPYVSLAIQYKSGDVLLRHAVNFSQRTLKTLSADEKEQMTALLTDWLDTKLKESKCTSTN